jgi:ATP-binding cassette subfamily C protein
VLAAAFYTAGINALALTGPLYMLLLYGFVLPAHAGDKLLALTALMLVLYGLSAWLDLARLSIFAGCARRIDRELRPRIAMSGAPGPNRDLDRIRAFFSGQSPAALCDLPWTPLYLGLVFALHALLGLLAILGAASLIACVYFTERSTRSPLLAAAALRALRPALQSAMLGLGAYLAMTGACHPASMFAASIMLGRTLGPLEMAIAHWRSFAEVRESAARLHAELSAPPGNAQSLPAPRIQIVLRPRGYARRASGVTAASPASGLRPTAE